MPVQRFRPAVAAALCLLALLASGCGPTVISKHPLTSPQTTTIDERLIGPWLAVPRDESQQPATQICWIGRQAGNSAATQDNAGTAEPAQRDDPAPSALELVFVRLVDDVVDVERVELLTLPDGPRRGWGSIRAEGADARGYLLVRYELTEVDGRSRLDVYFLDRDFLVSAIERGDLAGQVARTEATPPSAGDIQRVTITAPAPELLAFLRAHEAAVWDDDPLRLERGR